MEFFTAPGNVPFSIALAVVLLLGGLEVLSLLIGGASSLVSVDGHSGLDVGHVHTDGGPCPLPHGDLSAGTIAHADVTHTDVSHADVGTDGGLLSNVLSWLHAGYIPSTILFLLFLLGFAVSGFGLQNLMISNFGTMLPSSIAVWPAGIIAILSTRVTGGILRPILPRDESEAVSLESFIGCSAHINIGTARPGKPAEARLRDRYGRTHYVMVEPENNEEFTAGSPVLIIKRHDHIYRVIDNTSGEV